MKKATKFGVASTSIFYLSCGCIGYRAFGNNAPGNFLTGFGFYEPFWLIDIANICIIIHLVGAYQVSFSFSFFGLVFDLFFNSYMFLIFLVSSIRFHQQKRRVYSHTKFAIELDLNCFKFSHLQLLEEGKWHRVLKVYSTAFLAQRDLFSQSPVRYVTKICIKCITVSQFDDIAIDQIN